MSEKPVSSHEIHFAAGSVRLKDEVHCHFVDLPPLPGETGTQYNARALAWLMTKPERPLSLWQRLKGWVLG